MSDVKRMDIREFREHGYLQEVNRQFLHPLGLALEVIVEDDGTERLGGIWDCRDDPVGVMYGPDVPERDKADRICEEVASREAARREVVGHWVQPA